MLRGATKPAKALQALAEYSSLCPLVRCRVVFVMRVNRSGDVRFMHSWGAELRAAKYVETSTHSIYFGP